MSRPSVGLELGAGSDEKVAVIAAPVYDLPTRTAVSNVFLYARRPIAGRKHQTLVESTVAKWRAEALCV